MTHKHRIALISLTFLLMTSCFSPSVDAPPSAPAPATVSPTFAAPTNDLASSSFLHVQGQDILDASGQPIHLRGFNFHTYYYSYQWDPAAPQTYATQQDIEYIKSLGATVIRLGFHWRYFDTDLGFDLLDSYLDWCEQAGIYVILDMHVVPPEDDILEGRMWDDPAAQQNFLDLWTAIATRYADRAIVAGYDPYNEPLPPDPAQWWNLAERAVAAIRTVDANHILFIENPLNEDNAFQLQTDPNVVYSFHEYEPFLVSHATADWVGDSPIPSDYSYPGEILTEINWADWAEDAASLDVPAPEWQPFDSGVLTVPPGVEFATLKLSVSGQTGAVWFDDLEAWHNGVQQTLYNPGMEEESALRLGEPANWSFWTDSGVTGVWSAEHAHSGARSLQLTSGEGGFGVWTQSDWLFTAPLFRVQPGDTFQVRGWVLAPQNNGSAQMDLDYLNGVYENFDRNSLVAVMQPYLDWAATNNVPLFVGEFGAMSASPGDSRYHLVADTISVMNEAGLHWTIWNYRDPSMPGFGLYFGDDLDERLADILRQGLNGVRVYLPLIASPEGGEPSCPAENTLRALACRRDFHLGSAAVAYLLPEEPEYAQTLAREFNMVTADYEMKFAHIHPEPDVYDFQWSDLFVEFAEQNNMLIRGHTLLWYVEDPDWVKNGDWTREELIEVMRGHIYTLMGRYQNLYAWDVVNEGVYDEDNVYDPGSAHLRENKWLEVIGGDYMDLAFQFAREADPNALLFYNDYGGEGLGAKSDAIYNLLKDMRSRGVPVDGVGLQMHVSLEYLEDYPSQSDLRANIRRLADLGLIVHITELDVAIRKPVTPEKLEQQAEIYRSVLEVCLSEPACEAVVVWGFTDKHSWIPDDFPEFDAACLFDALYQPKPAYDSVQQVLAAP